MTFNVGDKVVAKHLMETYYSWGKTTDATPEMVGTIIDNCGDKWQVDFRPSGGLITDAMDFELDHVH